MKTDTKLIILDRDGIINQDSLHYIKSPDEFILLPGSAQAIARLNAAGYRIAVATNQSGVARGLYDLAQLAAIHEKMLAGVQAAGGRIDVIEYCPHMPDSGCPCRKPQPGLLNNIAKRLGCSLMNVPFVGDRVSDIQAAEAVGAQPIMILSSMTDKMILATYPHVPVFNSLADYVDDLLLPRLSTIMSGTTDKLALLSPGFSPLCVDFNSITVQKRRDEGRKQGLVRACKPAKGMRIVDATAGWGRDAAILASFGAEVLMLERQPMMAALLADGLNRLPPNTTLKLSLLHMDARQYFQSLTEPDYPDVIYIDPMHPARQKSALVKKDMQVLQRLIGSDTDVSALIQLAITCTRQRVVVKWPQREPALLQPDASISGKTVRFDIYLPISRPN